MRRADNDNDKVARTNPLPFGVASRGFSRTEAAAYIGVSPSLFDEMVKDARMPSPKQINTRTVWDRLKLDIAFDALPDREEANPWDDEPEAVVGKISNEGWQRRN